MPAVRFGPDIADDAAFIMNNLVDINSRFKKTGKLDKNFGRYAKLAKDIFGVSEKDIRAGRFGELGQLAQYSIDGRNARGKAYKRSKMARSWRTGKLRQRGIRQEFEMRGQPRGREIRGATDAGRGGGTYLGRTTTKKFEELSQRAYARAARKNVKYGRASINKKDIKEGRGSAAFDKLNIAQQGKMLPNITQGGYGATGKKSGSIRPPLAKSAKRATQARTKTSRTVAAAGRAPGKRSTAKPKSTRKPRR